MEYQALCAVVSLTDSCVASNPAPAQQAVLDHKLPVGRDDRRWHSQPVGGQPFCYCTERVASSDDP